jgi:anti-sigma B factor antagonist
MFFVAPQPARLQITSTEVGWSLGGEIDASTAPSLTAAFLEGPNNPRAVVEVDVGAVTFMDSSGLRALLLLVKHVAESGGTVAMCRTPPQLKRLIQLAGADDMLDVRSDATVREQS